MNDMVEKQIILNRGDYTTCSINMEGGTVTSWKINHQEQIFVSYESKYTGLGHIRGGINFVFPYNGISNMGPDFGFARYKRWSLDHGPEKVNNGDVVAVLSLDYDAYSNSLYAFRFKLFYKITLCDQKLIFNIYIENQSTYFPCEFQILQHTAFKVPDVTKCVITGLNNCRYQNENSDKMGMENEETLMISKEINRLYFDVPCEVIVTNMINGATLKITRKWTSDVNVWNPWDRTDIPNLGLDEFPYFIVLESGRVMKPIRIEPLTCWEARHTYEMVPNTVYKHGAVHDFYDLFNDYC